MVKKSASLLVLLLISACFGTSLFLFGISNVGASSSSATWYKLYGGESDDEAAAIVQADDGGYVIAGTTYSFGAGGADFWLIKIDADGGMEWNCTYGGAEADVATAMIQTRDGGYALAGKTCSFGAGESDFWLIKVDSSGKLQWNRTYGEPTADGANSLIQTRDGGYAMVGYVTDNNESKNVWFIKTDSTGNIQWNRNYGEESSWENGYSVIQTSDGGYALAGSTNAYSEDVAHDCWLIKVDSDGNMEWNQTYDGDGGFDDVYVLLQASDGGYTFAGNTGGFIGRNVWVVRIDSNGNTLWDTIWETPEPTQTTCLIQASNGGYAVTGWSNELGEFNNFSSYMFLIKLDANGNIQWNSTYNALGDNTALFAVQTDDSDYALAGTTRPTDEGACCDIWFAKVDASGETIPEFPSWATLLITLVTVVAGAVIYRQKMSKANKRGGNQ